MQEPVSLDPETLIHIVSPVPSTANELNAAVIHADAAMLRARFEAVTIPERELLTTVLHTRADA